MNWTSVKEKLPQADGYYLCAIIGEKAAKLRKFSFDAQAFFANGIKVNNVTHWMTLPRLPI